MTIPVGCRAEYAPIKTILLCEPGPELLYALVWPKAANFEEVFDSQEAIDEHKRYQQYLRRHGLAVYLLVDLLAANPKLVAYAAKAVGFSNPLATLSQSELEQNVSGLGILDQVRLLTERPKMNVSQNPNLQLDSVTVKPFPNLYFMRDQLIVTDRGVIVGRFDPSDSAIRQGEQDIVKKALEAAGIVVRYEIADPGVLEGGDFIPAGEWGLFGCGLRTNHEAIDQLLTGRGADWLGYRHLAVIIDPPNVCNIQEMHLDTYFMLIGQDTCLVVNTRVRPPNRKKDPNAPDKRPTVEIYDKSPNSEDYARRPGPPMTFRDFLKNELKIRQIITLREEDQREYGINVLCLEDRKIVGSKRDDQHPKQLRSYEQKLAKAGVNFDLLRFTNIRKGFGSNHCMCQVFLRG